MLRSALVRELEDLGTTIAVLEALKGYLTCRAMGDFVPDGEADGEEGSVSRTPESAAPSSSSSDGQQHALVSILSGLNKRRRLGYTSLQRADRELREDIMPVENVEAANEFLEEHVPCERRANCSSGFHAYQLSGEAVVADLSPGEDGVLCVAVAKQRLAIALGVHPTNVVLSHLGEVDELRDDETVRRDLQVVVLQALRVATASMDRSVKMWNADSGVCESVWVPFVWDADYQRASWSPCGKYFAAASAGCARIWNVETNVSVTKFECKDTTVLTAIFSPCASRLATCCKSGRMDIWNVEAGECEVSVSNVGSPFSMSFSPDGRRIVVAPGIPGAVSLPLWDTLTGACDLTLPVGFRSSIAAVCFSPDGQRLAVTGPAYMASVWSLLVCSCIFCSSSTYSPTGHFVGLAW